MLVGTAKTGQETNPPTTLGSAPSMPAMATMAQQFWSVGTWARRRWRPAMPTSVMGMAGTDMDRKVIRDSAATGESLVPAETTAMGGGDGLGWRSIGGLIRAARAGWSMRAVGKTSLR